MPLAGTAATPLLGPGDHPNKWGLRLRAIVELRRFRRVKQTERGLINPGPLQPVHGVHAIELTSRGEVRMVWVVFAQHGN